MDIFRIEHSNMKVGPYIGGGLEYSYRYWNPETAPDPSQDGLIGLRRRYEFSGFASLKQLTDWFLLKDIWKMRKKGFRVYRFKVTRRVVRKGFKQVAFARHTAFAKQEVTLGSLAMHRAVRFITRE